MPLTYLDAISLAFGSSPFSVQEFGVRLGCPRPHRRLSELKTRGLVERVGRGQYRLLGPEERPDLRGREAARVRRLLLDSGLPMAWTGPSAVHLWTGGRYTVSPSVFLREFHIEVPPASVGRWKEYLRDHRVATTMRRRIGIRVTLHMARRIRAVRHRGEPVVPRTVVSELIRAHPGIYADAEELLEKQH